ncbi:A24 family peptidase [Bacillus sp. T3]|uniref:A24 family peptidase n=1 Tax=Bacillus sp. T3 TaxID=467262 RepID=UPI002981D247|nr:A24 family peptidase [Bacillus sp. T3]
MFIPIVLGSVLIISLVTDIRKRRIFNIVTIPAIFIGLVYYTITIGWDGFLLSGKGFLVGLGLLLIPYLMGGMGAGDVKLMAAIGALMGPEFTLYSFIYTALLGGIIALIIIIKSKGLLNLIKSWWYILKSIFFKIVFLKNDLGEIVYHKNKSTASNIAFPYGVAIVLGTVCAVVLGG